jgi:excisionase family DNA binding protein
MTFQESPKKRSFRAPQGCNHPLKSAQKRKKAVKTQIISRAHIWWCHSTTTPHNPHISPNTRKMCPLNTKKHPKLTKYFLTRKIRSSYKRIKHGSRECLFTFLIGQQRGARFRRKVASMTETREVMDIREASEYLGVSRETLYKYVYEEKLPAFKLGNRWKFKKTVLDRWMEKQSAQFEQRAARRLRATAR